MLALSSTLHKLVRSPIKKSGMLFAWVRIHTAAVHDRGGTFNCLILAVWRVFSFMFFFGGGGGGGLCLIH